MVCQHEGVAQLPIMAATTCHQDIDICIRELNHVLPSTGEDLKPRRCDIESDVEARPDKVWKHALS